jgi:hypothetical protein
MLLGSLMKGLAGPSTTGAFGSLALAAPSPKGAPFSTPAERPSPKDRDPSLVYGENGSRLHPERSALRRRAHAPRASRAKKLRFRAPVGLHFTCIAHGRSASPPGAGAHSPLGPKCVANRIVECQRSASARVGQSHLWPPGLPEAGLGSRARPQLLLGHGFCAPAVLEV